MQKLNKLMQPSIYLNLLYSIHGAYQKRELFLYTYALRYCLVARMNTGIGWNEIKIGNPYGEWTFLWTSHPFFLFCLLKRNDDQIDSEQSNRYKCHQGKNETKKQRVHDYEKVRYCSLIELRKTHNLNT